MSERVRKAGSWTILIGAMVTIISTIMLNTSSWAVTQLTEVEPIKKTMNAILKEGRSHEEKAVEFREASNVRFGELVLLIHNQNTLIADGRARLLSVEKNCEENHRSIRDCQDRHYDILNDRAE